MSEDFIYKLTNNGVGNSRAGTQYNSDSDQIDENTVNGLISQQIRNQTERMVMASGDYRSQNFLTGFSGWQIDSLGNAEFNNGTFRGTFTLGGTLITVSDIANLGQAITDVSNAGGGTVSLVPDTYMATQSYTIPDGVTIDGNGSTIDFGAGAFQFLIQGTNAYSTGTLAVSYGSANVVGTGTTWTSAMVGQSILIGDYWYTILTRTDNTHITIEYSPGNGYMGLTVSGASYVIATTVNGAGVNNITLTNSSTTALKFRYVNGLNLNTLGITNSAQAIDGDDSANVNLQGGYFIDDCTVGITYDNVPFCIFLSGLISNITGGTAMALNGVTNTALNALSIQAITGVGAKLTNCGNFSFEEFSIIECTSHGVEMVSGNNDINFEGGYTNSCGGDGLKLTATSDRVTIVASSYINNGGYGINIASSTCDNNQIIAPAFSNNTAGSINDGGTGTFISPQTLSTFIAQEIALIVGTTVYTYVQMTSDATGTVLFIAILTSNLVRVFRLLKGTVTQNYNITHSTTITLSGTQALKGICVQGSFVYVGVDDNNTGKLWRYAIADLSGVTAMTISGTNSFAGNNTTMWSDGIYLWVQSVSGVADVYRNYSISGTTATNVGTTTFTTAGNGVASISNNTNVWITDVTDGTVNIRKYPIAGGAATSTTVTMTVFAAYPNGMGIGFFLSGTTILGLGFIKTLESNTATTGSAAQLTGIALP